ncbi:S14077Ig kappa chain - African clawed frog [Pelobates cultripes]|uniref:S14077Ig kappa chain - African clawed frog n=1 Tax=Pelobates cultripes TaxID=61616 RepID=A0AAD1S4X3_PELCU|nr:S14077Ig kappa chain - African clawed frog [Pelobates cultripes]
MFTGSLRLLAAPEHLHRNLKRGAGAWISYVDSQTPLLTPAVLSMNKGVTTTFNCDVGVKNNHATVFYRQSPGEVPQLLLYHHHSYTEPKYGPGMSSAHYGCTINSAGTQYQLIIKNTDTSDTGLLYCSKWYDNVGGHNSGGRGIELINLRSMSNVDSQTPLLTPTHLSVNKGQTATFNCDVGIKDGYVTAFLRQSPGEAPQLLLYHHNSYTEPKYGTGMSSSHYGSTVNSAGTQYQLVIKNTDTSDTYFLYCAKWYANIGSHCDTQLNKNSVEFVADLGIPSFDAKTWGKVGCTEIHHLYEDNRIIPFPELQTKHNIPSRALFSYLQLNSLLTGTKIQAPNPQNSRNATTHCLSGRPPKKILSHLYTALIAERSGAVSAAVLVGNRVGPRRMFLAMHLGHITARHGYDGCLVAYVRSQTPVLSPPVASVGSGQSFTFNCIVGVKDVNGMAFLKQSEGEPPKFIFGNHHSYQSPVYGPGMSSTHYTGSINSAGTEYQLIITNADITDTSLYHCAKWYTSLNR